MERFIRRENIKRYRKLLLETKDDAERRLIQRLLTAEEQKEPPRSSLPMLPANAMREQPRAGLFTVRQRSVRWCQAHTLTSELWLCSRSSAKKSASAVAMRRNASGNLKLP